MADIEESGKNSEIRLEDLIELSERTEFDGRYIIQTTDCPSGAYKKVVMAKHKYTGKKVALMFFKKGDEIDKNTTAFGVYGDEGGDVLFKGEVGKLSRFDGNTLLPRIIDANEIEIKGHKVRYIVEEWIDGETLADVIKNHKERNTRLPIRHIVRYLYDVAESLSSMHSAGVCHLDAAKQNIIINGNRFGNDDYSAKIIDFGTAQTLHSNDPARNAGLLSSSPEQLNRVGDKHSDEWGFGILLYELLELKHPFASDEEIASMRSKDKDIENKARESIKKKIWEDEPAPVERRIGSELQQIINTALQKERFERDGVLDMFREYCQAVDDFYSMDDLEKRVRQKPMNRKRLGMYRKFLQLLGKTEITHVLYPPTDTLTHMFGITPYNNVKGCFQEIGDFVMSQRDAWPSTGGVSKMLELTTGISYVDLVWRNNWDSFVKALEWNYFFRFAVNLVIEDINNPIYYHVSKSDMEILQVLYESRETPHPILRGGGDYHTVISADRSYSAALKGMMHVMNNKRNSAYMNEYREREMLRDTLMDTFVYDRLVSLIAEDWLYEYENGWNGLEDWTGKAGFPIGRLVLARDYKARLKDIDQRLHDFASFNMTYNYQDGKILDPSKQVAIHPADMPGETRSKEEIDSIIESRFFYDLMHVFRDWNLMESVGRKLVPKMKGPGDIETLFKGIVEHIKIDEDSVGQAIKWLYDDFSVINSNIRKKKITASQDYNSEVGLRDYFYNMQQEKTAELVLESIRFHYALADICREKDRNKSYSILEQTIENIDTINSTGHIYWDFDEETGSVIYHPGTKEDYDEDKPNFIYHYNYLNGSFFISVLHYLRTKLLMKKADMLDEDGDSKSALELLSSLKFPGISQSIGQITDIRLRSAEISAQDWLNLDMPEKAADTFRKCYNSPVEGEYDSRIKNLRDETVTDAHLVDYELTMRPKIIKSFLNMLSPSATSTTEEIDLYDLYNRIHG